MTSKPWMPLYIADYLADTPHLGAFESGAYLHPIMHQWQCGELPIDERSLARIARVQPRYWPRIRKALAPFFGNPKSGEPWVQKRTAIELRKAQEISSKRKGAALQMHGKSKAIAVQMHTQSQSQLQTDAPATPKPSIGSSLISDTASNLPMRSQDSAVTAKAFFLPIGPARRCTCRAGSFRAGAPGRSRPPASGSWRTATAYRRKGSPIRQGHRRVCRAPSRFIHKDRGSTWTSHRTPASYHRRPRSPRALPVTRTRSGIWSDRCSAAWERRRRWTLRRCLPARKKCSRSIRSRPAARLPIRAAAIPRPSALRRLWQSCASRWTWRRGRIGKSASASARRGRGRSPRSARPSSAIPARARAMRNCNAAAPRLGCRSASRAGASLSTRRPRARGCASATAFRRKSGTRCRL
ncbi:MAG: YdaU family protein [Xanthobacteraceae bacterium]|nr:YdaU family protein [Xanthobacteraceae bacterium]